MSESNETQGLTQIVAVIAEQSAALCEQIISDGKQRAEQITQQAQKEAQEAYDQKIEQAKQQIVRDLQNAESNAQAQHDRALLQEKVAAVDSVTEQALQQLCEAPDAEYFSILHHLILQHCQAGHGVLRLSAQDLARLPRDFMEKLQAPLAEKYAQLSLCETAAPLSYGFILQYGDIEENCSFSALIEEKRDLIRDTAASILFGKGEAS